MIRILCAVLLLQFVNVSVLSICAMADSESRKEMNVESKRKWGKETQGHAISIIAKNEVVSPGEPIILTISLKNVGTADIRVLETAPLAAYDIEVLGPNGEKVPLTLYGKISLESNREGSRSVSILKPGAESSVEIHLNRMFDFTIPGKYTVSVQRAIWKADTSPQKLKAISNKVNLTVDESLTSKPVRPNNSSEGK